MKSYNDNDLSKFVVTKDCPRRDMKQFVWLPIHLCESKVFSFLQSNDNIAMGEYFETDVKSEDNFDV